MEDSNPHSIVTSNDFKGNMTAISTRHYNGRKPKDLSLGFVIIRSSLAGPQESFFVGSQPGQDASAMILGWWTRVHGRNISRKDGSLIKTVYAELWDDEPGSGTHQTIDFIRDALAAEETVTIDPVNEVIDGLYARISELTPTNIDSAHRNAIGWVIDMLNSGKLRVAEKRIKNGEKYPGIPDDAYEWFTHQWIKKAILLFMKINSSKVMHGAYTQYYDKIPLKYADYSEETFSETGVRIVPPATVRKGSYIARGVILMPSYTNIGAYVDEGTMVDTWATVGSCAQIGKKCHLSGGVGIGGVLEPLQANPTIIEDNCFIGARSEIVEGVIVGEGSVISMGVYIGQSTKIYNRMTGRITFGYIPPGSVVVSGNLPSPDGKYSLYCAVIVKQVDAKTRSKTSINELLRDT